MRKSDLPATELGYCTGQTQILSERNFLEWDDWVNEALRDDVISSSPLQFSDVFLSDINPQTWHPRSEGIARKPRKIFEKRYIQPPFILGKTKKKMSFVPDLNQHPWKVNQYCAPPTELS